MFLRMALLDRDLLLLQETNTAGHRCVGEALGQRDAEVVEGAWCRDKDDFIVFEDLEVKHWLVHALIDVEIQLDIILTQLFIQLQEATKELESLIFLFIL